MRLTPLSCSTRRAWEKAVCLPNLPTPHARQVNRREVVSGAGTEGRQSLLSGPAQGGRSASCPREPFSSCLHKPKTGTPAKKAHPSLHVFFTALWASFWVVTALNMGHQSSPGTVAQGSCGLWKGCLLELFPRLSWGSGAGSGGA